MPTTDPELEALIRTESNIALSKGAWYALFLGIAFATHRLAQRERLHSGAANAVVIAFRCGCPLRLQS